MSFLGRHLTNEELMIQKQAELISRLQRDIKDMASDYHRQYERKLREYERKVNELNNYRVAGVYYMQIQDAVRNDENVRAEWLRFLAVIKLTTEEEIEGLTTSEYE